MLKWTVMPRRDAPPKSTDDDAVATPRTPASVGKTKRRRSSATSRRSNVRRRASDAGKENQFTSTPIKATENFLGFDALRDVSNLTPNVKCQVFAAAQKGKSEKKKPEGSPLGRHEKKKDCLSFHSNDLFAIDTQTSNYFRPFETVDSHIEAVASGDLCCCPKSSFSSVKKRVPDTYAPTLPTFGADYSPCQLRTTHCLETLNRHGSTKPLPITKLLGTPPNHVNDFLQQITFVASPAPHRDDSSLINNMSLDKIVDAILEESGREEAQPSLSSDSGVSCKTMEEKTIIQLNEPFNERCVDWSCPRKRRSSGGGSGVAAAKRQHLETTSEEFTLKRQRCVRRRRGVERLDFESTPVKNCYLETKGIPAALDGSSKISEASSFSESKSSLVDARGVMDLRVFVEGGCLVVDVVRCRGLHRPGGERINAYVKVFVNDRSSEGRTGKTKAALQRTAVQGDTNKPHFNHTFKLPLDHSEDLQKRVNLEVWHRDRVSRTSEFLGCMSFDVKHVTEEGVSGSFRLLPQSTGRAANVPVTHDRAEATPERGAPKMFERQYSVDELMSLDDPDSETRKQTLLEQQKHADENLFLRYLELDPTEGPDASSAATQRKATGNRNGRTPFTCTKRLTRPARTGFGFSVVWTHPPRIERVEKGLPADRAGILPGDYVIFVDKHNVVMMPEIDVLNLIRSYGSQLTLEIFRRNPSRNGSLPSVKRLSADRSIGASSVLPVASCATLPQRRPSTGCSTVTASVEYGRRRLNLPQVTFTSEKQTNNPEENRRKAMYQLVGKEQQYATGMQFAVTRFVSALAERKDLATPSEHRLLFQNCEEILRITEDILEQLVQEDGEVRLRHLVGVYRSKTHDITTAYKRYCSGIQKADCVLASKTKNSNSDFVRFLQVPQIPRRRPDITSFIHKPLEHYREVLRLLTVIQSNTKLGHDEFSSINQIIHDLQLTYREITSQAGLMEPLGEGRPLLTVQDLENRLVFTKCKPFVLNKPGRQWIFGGDLSRVEGRNVRQYWTLLFTDLLLFAKASRDRVLFVTEDPLPLAHIQDTFFNVRKKDTEFRITVNPEGGNAKSPTVHCGPDLSRTPKKNANKKTVILRAPTRELKAVWQNLLQRQIFLSTSGTEDSGLSSPLDSPDVLQSAESLSLRRQLHNHTPNCQNEIRNRIDPAIDLKCKQLDDKYDTTHLEQWIKRELRAETQPPSPAELEDWTEEMVRLRSRELQLVDDEGNVRATPAGCEDPQVENDLSPSKSTTGSQVTVRSPEALPVCRQCRWSCLGSSENGAGDCNSNPTELGLLGRSWEVSSWPSSGAAMADPFSVPQTAATTCDNARILLGGSPDDSPETEEHPYHSLSGSAATLRRYGTVSSLERDKLSGGSEEDNDADDEGGIENAAFDNSLRRWTATAGSFLAEKIDRYLNGERQLEEETSGGTSGEEVWGTPTSGDMDDNLDSPDYGDKQSPNDGSISSDYGDETEIMMDELLMTPPMSGAVLRGLLPRRTLEPLIEEDDSETSTSSSSIDSMTDPSVSPEQAGQRNWRCC